LKCLNCKIEKQLKKILVPVETTGKMEKNRKNFSYYEVEFLCPGCLQKSHTRLERVHLLNPSEELLFGKELKGKKWTDRMFKP